MGIDSSEVQQVKRQTPGLHPKRNTIAGVVGNVLEWYDFAVFGYYAPYHRDAFFSFRGRILHAVRVVAHLPYPHGGARRPPRHDDKHPRHAFPPMPDSDLGSFFR